MIYVIGKMDLRKRENEMFVEVFPNSLTKFSHLIRQEQIAGSINRASQIVCLPFIEKTPNSIQKRCSSIPLFFGIG
jgi:hypothetical protein